MSDRGQEREKVPRLVRIVFSDDVAAGTFVLDGVRIVTPADDEALGRELRTVEVRVHGNQDGMAIRQIVEKTDDLELTP